MPLPAAALVVAYRHDLNVLLENRTDARVLQTLLCHAVACDPKLVLRTYLLVGICCRPWFQQQGDACSWKAGLMCYCFRAL